jgi:protein-tyrosine-phosphatase/predicted ATP-grasp superfamily ATP-dependent carboligase
MASPLSHTKDRPVVLVLDGHCPAAIEAVQSLGRAGAEVHVASTTPEPLAFHSKYVTQKLQQPTSAQPQEFVSWLAQLDEKHRYALIIPSTDAALLPVCALPEENSLRKKAVLASAASFEMVLDKEKTWQLAKRLGVPVPESILIESVDNVPAARKFPVILKPIRSKVTHKGEMVSLAPQIVHDDYARREVLQNMLVHNPVQQQEIVPGWGAGVEMLFQNGKKVWHFGHDRVHEVPLTGGGSTYRRSLFPSPAMLEAAEKILTELKWHGVAMVEFRMCRDGSFYLLEINPRFWGSLALSIDAGVDFPVALLKIARGEPVPPQPTYQLHYSRRLAKDLDWLRANWRADHNDPSLLTKPRLRSLIELARPLIGKESWDHFDLRDPGVTFEMLRRIVVEHVAKVRDFVKRKAEVRRVVAEQRRLMAKPLPVRKLLFLCFGNICRSPFAGQLAKVRLPACTVEAAGFHHKVNRKSPANVLNVARQMEIDLTDHRSMQVTARQVEQADLILLMDMKNYHQLAQTFPNAVSKAVLLGLFASQPRLTISDPYEKNEQQTAVVLRQIDDAVCGLGKWLESRAPEPVRSEASPELTPGRINS